MSDVADELFEALAEQIKRMDEEAIWDLDDCARHMKVAPETARKKMNSKGGPKPCLFQKNRWPAKRVKEWASRV